MKIELDAQYDILYLELREGDVDETVDLDDGVHLDLDAEDRVVGLEFLSLDAFRAFLERHNGRVEIPDAVENHDASPLLRQQTPGYDLDLLREAVSSLDPPQQEVVRLYFMEGFKMSEIAERLGIPRRTVSYRLRAALSELRAMLREEVPEEDERSLEAALSML